MGLRSLRSVDLSNQMKMDYYVIYESGDYYDLGLSPADKKRLQKAAVSQNKTFFHCYHDETSLFHGFWAGLARLMLA